MPCGHFSLSSLIPATPSIESGKRGDVGDPGAQVEDRVREREQERRRHDRHRRPAGPSPQVTSRAQKPLPSGRGARSSSQPSADRPQRLSGPSGSAARMRGIQVAGRPRLTRSPRIASVAGRNVRLPMTDTSTTAIVPIAIDVNSDDAEGDQAGQRDHHREAREEDRPAGGAARDLDRLGAVAAGPSLDPEAGDHEQRVVDRDGEPDEHDQLGRVRADRRRRSGCRSRGSRTPPAAT